MKIERVKTGLVFVALIIMLAAGLTALEVSVAQEAEKEPVRITAGKMEVKSEENVILFQKDVIAVQGDITIAADRLKIITRKGGERDIEEMVASGNVQFRQFFPEENIERFATGRKAQYWDDEGKLILTGEPKAWEADNVITGETMTFYTRENLFLVDGEVKVIFYPEKGSENLGGKQTDSSSVDGEAAPQELPASDAEMSGVTEKE